MAEHNSIEGCRMNWSGEGAYPRAGQAMSKALHAVGLTTNPLAGRKVGIITEPHDSYHLHVLGTQVDKLVAELRKDDRVVTISVDGVEQKAKTVEDVEAEFAAFKATVVAVAMKKAKAHDWCEVVKDALVEMGLEVPQRKTRVVLEIDLADDDNEDYSSVRDLIYDLNRDDLRESIKTVESVNG